MSDWMIDRLEKCLRSEDHLKDTGRIGDVRRTLHDPCKLCMVQAGEDVSVNMLQAVTPELIAQNVGGKCKIRKPWHHVQISGFRPLW